MKKNYVKPSIMSEKFLSTEYIAACWKNNCNVSLGIGFIDKDGDGKYDNGEEICKLNPRSGCEDWHKGVEGVPGDGPTANAMWQPVRRTFFGYTENGEPYPVYWWSTGSSDSDQHFSKVSSAQWETNPNAS